MSKFDLQTLIKNIYETTHLRLKLFSIILARKICVERCIAFLNLRYKYKKYLLEFHDTKYFGDIDEFCNSFHYFLNQ